ncbi:hypothetical protein [Dactylosporangium darangshiense]|uniref:Uncharacterized protein n=1 Tax=Dactylosporangium darangshiense TaxID=579108 RepID=A0ABP8DPN3_9ACTN
MPSGWAAPAYRMAVCAVMPNSRIAGTGPHVMAALRNAAIGGNPDKALALFGVT